MQDESSVDLSHPTGNLAMLAWAIRIAAVVAAAPSLFANGAKFDPIDELDVYPELRRGLLRYRQHSHRVHRRHHHPHRRSRVPLFGRHRARHMALAHHSADLGTTFSRADLDLETSPVLSGPVDWSPRDDHLEPAPKAVVKPMALPGRHPSVEKALDGMSGDLQSLKEKQMVAKQDRAELEGKVSEVVHHMNDAMSIKHAISQKEAALRIQKNKIRALEREVKHLDQTHGSLVNSLHRVLEPKLMFAASRLEKKERVAEKEAQAANGWKEKKEQLHIHALQLIKEKNAAHQSLLEAQAEVARAKQREELADKRYRSERQDTSREVASYRYAETRFKAEITHEEAAERQAVAAKRSVEKLRNVMQVESEKVEMSIAASKQRLERKMRELEAVREHAGHELDDLQQRYSEWQASQRERAAEVVKKSEDTAAASEAFAVGQKQVLDSAQSKVAKEAESKSDWAWQGGDFSNDDGESESLPAEATFAAI